MRQHPTSEATIHDLCALLEAHAQDTTHQQRIDAAMLTLQRLGYQDAKLVAVHAAAFSRSAVYRLDGAIIPRGHAEITAFGEQVGPGMILLGMQRTHYVVTTCGLMIELAHSHEWHDRGVLLRPFVKPIPGEQSRWTASQLRFGVEVAYERRELVPDHVAPDLTSRRLAEQITRSLRPLHNQDEHAALGA
jgi:hypothetical protein